MLPIKEKVYVKIPSSLNEDTAILDLSEINSYLLERYTVSSVEKQISNDGKLVLVFNVRPADSDNCPRFYKTPSF